VKSTADILVEYDELIRMGRGDGGTGGSGYSRFRTAGANLIRRTCGSDSDHYREIKALSEGPSATNDFYGMHCQGIVEAARRDIERGLLFDMRALVAAEVLGDFLDQASALLDSGYHIAAVSVAGAVLEDSLRRLMERHQLPVPAKTKIDALNAALAKAGVYNVLVQKQITVLADLRNKADHGRFDEVTRDDAADLVTWIARFDADYLR